MQQVSEAWKEAHRKNLLPESFIEISVGNGDPTAQDNAESSDNGHEPYSQVGQVTTSTKQKPIKYATLEPYLWVLDGTYRILED